LSEKRFKSGWGKPSGRVADFFNAQKSTVLLGKVQAHMIKEASKPSDRRQDVVHPSEVAKTGWCPKSTYERIKAAREASNPFLKAVAESYSPQLLNIFDEGHYIHDKWQKRLRDMGELWGNWVCEVCDKRFKDVLYPGQCWGCDSTLLTYKEVPLRNDDFLIAGHADGAVPSLNALIEIKSVGTGTVRIEAPDIFKKNSEGSKIDLTGLWRDITEPFPSHIRQGQLYLYLCEELGLSYNKIIFIYESKFNQGAKEFVVEYDYAVVHDILMDIRNIVSILGGSMPNGEDCPVCSKVNLPYPFICECVDEPVKCPYNGCKDCEPYGNKNAAIRVGDTEAKQLNEPDKPARGSRVSTTAQTGNGAARTSKRVV